jgi:EAL domain-containing protein (putative c-di-GMP-specific phosphodiesterase class I)
VVAKGVENAEQLALLQALDCNFAQGFYFKEPLSTAQVESVLASDVVLQLAAAA